MPLARPTYGEIAPPADAVYLLHLARIDRYELSPDANRANLGASVTMVDNLLRALNGSGDPYCFGHGDHPYAHAERAWYTTMALAFPDLDPTVLREATLDTYDVWDAVRTLRRNAADELAASTGLVAGARVTGMREPLRDGSSQDRTIRFVGTVDYVDSEGGSTLVSVRDEAGRLLPLMRAEWLTRIDS